MLSDRTRGGLQAAGGAVLILGLALVLPHGWPQLGLAVAVVAFFLYLFFVPKYWYRRKVNSVLLLWAGAIATPSFLAEGDLGRFSMEGGGWAVHLTLCVAYIASLVASLVHELQKDRAAQPASSPVEGRIVHGDSVGGDKIAGDKVGGNQTIAQGDITQAGRDVVHGDSFGGDKITINQPSVPPATSYLNQIPEPVADFVGRDDEIGKLLAVFEGSGQGAVIVGARGMGGVGKTELAKVLAKRIKDRFPDGQIYFNLRGASDDDSKEPATAAEALSHVVQSFHPEARLPEEIDALRGICHSALEGKRVLLLMDNALDAGQLGPLSPPPDGCALMVTSRHRFELAGMEAIDVDTLKPEDARELLLEICPRIGQEADALAELCGYLPLALRLAASALKSRPTLEVAKYMEDLGAEEGRLATLDKYKGATGEDLGVTASLAISYNLLDEGMQEFWRALGVFTGDFDSVAAGRIQKAATLLDLAKAAALWMWNRMTGRPCRPADGHDTETALGDLHAASMVQWEETTGRFHVHDLARDYARDQLSEEERVGVELHHALLYLMVLSTADHLYMKGGDSILQGLALFDREWGNISAGQKWAAGKRGTYKIVARLCNDYPNAGVHCLGLRLHPREHIVWFEAASDAAQLLEDFQAESNHLGNLGIVYTGLGETRKAIELLERVLEIYHISGDRHGEEKALVNLGSALLECDEGHKAIECFQQSIVLTKEIEDRRAEGNSLCGLGTAHAALGEPRKAIEHHLKALAISKEFGDRRVEGAALCNLGIDYAALDEEDKAIEFFEEALAIERDIGDRSGEGNTCHQLACVLSTLGRDAEAVAYAEKAVAIFEAIESPHAAKPRALLDRLRG